MGKIELRVQNLENGELFNAEIESEEQALAWLEDRPRFMMVLGLATPGLPKELIEKMKAVTRRLDEDETALSRKLDDAQRAEIEKRMHAEEARARAEIEKHRVA